MRFHLATLPHTLPTPAYTHCAFTSKVRKFATMMRARGHKVFVYEAADPLPPDQNLTQSFDANHPRWAAHNADCIARIGANLQPRDFIGLIGGICQQPIMQAFPDHMSVEYGVGYFGVFAPYCVFESYAHRNNVYGRLGLTRGRFFDAVIPNYYDPAEFPRAETPSDYLLFIGRLNEDKGLYIATEVAKRTGRRLVVAGQGVVPDGVDYRGLVGVAERSDLMAHAHAVLAPTIYPEPFGGVAVEAQLCGTPVITTDFGAFPETVEQGRTGFRCSYVGEFIDAVNSTGELDRDYIQRRARSLYSMSVVAAQYERYFDRLMLLWADGWNTA